jgi:hypothetical protein
MPDLASFTLSARQHKRIMKYSLHPAQPAVATDVFTLTAAMPAGPA